MTSLRRLEEKIKDIESRLEKIEELVASSAFVQDKEWMNELYKKASELVLKHNKASAIFLQRQLMIDYERATRLMDELQVNGVIGPELGGEPRRILVKK